MIIRGPRPFHLTDAAFVAVAVVVPVVEPDAAALGFVAVQFVFFALGLTILVGWVGLLDLGAAGFVAVGAYATAIGLTAAGWPAVAVLPAAGAAGAVAGVVLGLPALRHRADYFAILTLGFAELVAQGIRNWPAVTKGAYGYSGIPAPSLPWADNPLRAVPPTGYYYFALAVAIPVFYAVVRLRATRWGRHCHVIRYSETVAVCYGMNVFRVKLLAFAVSAALLATGGFFWAAYQRSIVWTEFGVPLSCLLIAVVVVGGVGSPRGAVLGAAIVGTALEVLRRLLTEYGLPQNVRYLVFATAIVVFVHVRPRGMHPDRPSWPATDDPPLPHAPAPCGHLLRAEGLAKRFGGVQAVDGLTIEVRAGECVAVIGPNGSGKTTLINLLTGVIRPDRGTVTVGRSRVDGRRPYRVAAAGVGRSFQEVSVFGDISVGDNLVVTGDRVTTLEVSAALTAFNLPPADTLAAGLSYGDQKVLDLARLFVRPSRWRVVLLDEPTAGLTQQDTLALVASLATVRRATGMAMLVVSHDVLFLEHLGVDRVVVLDRGQVFREGAFQAMRSDPAVQALFWGRTGMAQS
jgi:ABC-type branched-subunit amino acid transport system permease subunit/ABC-type branched-subunit amino acid transport system ATPase component